MVDVEVGSAVGVLVAMAVAVLVTVPVAVLAGVLTGVCVAVLVDVGEGVLVAVGAGVGVLVAVGVGPGVGVPVLYSTCSSGAPAGSPLYDSAVRLPLPVMIMASELPLDQPGRLTISWMMAAISGVR